MSYDVYLADPVTHEVLTMDVPHQMRGGTYAIGGTDKMWVNITYNYALWYYKDYAFGEKGIRSIYGLSGAESIPVLKKAIAALEDSDEELPYEEAKACLEQGATGYWLPTRTNAIRPLYQLLALAQMRPDGVWKGD